MEVENHRGPAGVVSEHQPEWRGMVKSDRGTEYPVARPSQRPLIGTINDLQGQLLDLVENLPLVAAGSIAVWHQSRARNRVPVHRRPHRRRHPGGVETPGYAHQNRAALRGAGHSKTKGPLVLRAYGHPCHDRMVPEMVAVVRTTTLPP
jgi:hypothetical protein